MASTPKVRRLFPFYAANLTLYLGDYLDTFVCPVCLRSFTSDVLGAAMECPVSEGHIFPESIGGGEVTLECRECNNQLGSQMDLSLSGEFKWQEFQIIRGKQKATINTAEGRRPVTVECEGDEMTIHEAKKCPLPGRKDQESVGKLFSQPWSLTFNTGHSPQKLRVAMFHSAFLLLFRVFGYEYVLSAGGKSVGQWLQARALPRKLLALTTN